MAKRTNKAAPQKTARKKRNLAAKAAKQAAAGPMKDKRRISRQEQKSRDRGADCE